MLDNLIRLREPAAWTVLAVTAASIVLALVRFVLGLSTGEPFSAAAQDVALQAMNLTLVIVVVALVWACVFHSPTPGAPRLVAAAAWIVTIGTVLTILGAVLGLTASAGVVGVVLEFLGGLLDIILKLIGAATLWLIHRGLRGGRITVPQAVEAAPPAAIEPEQPKGPAPSWTADAASGSVWTSASAAAEGAAPTGHGVPGAASGWHPVARPEPTPGDDGEEQPHPAP